MNKLFTLLCLLLLLSANQVYANFSNNAHLHKETFKLESLPDGIPTKLSIPIEYLGESFSLELEKNYVFGKNTRILVDNGNSITEIDKGEERTYIGYIPEHPKYKVSAIMTDEGLKATIGRPNLPSLKIEPSGADRSSYDIFIAQEEQRTESCSHQSCSPQAGHSAALPAIDEPAPITCGKEVFDYPASELEVFDYNNHISSTSRSSSNATLRPNQVITVREFEIGVEIGSRAFLSNYNGDIRLAREVVQGLITNLDNAYLHSAGVKHKLGTVLIRTSASSDPLRDQVVSTGTDANAIRSLSAFGRYWDNNPSIVGTTHDLAIYHIRWAPSGLASRVNGIGTSGRYCTTGSNGPTAWADNIGIHEVGHLWGLNHVENGNRFYESRPRNNNGSSSSGGNDFFISVMHGSDNHNIRRLASTEAATVRRVKNANTSEGPSVNPGPVRPYGVVDRIGVAGSNAVVIDVIANDYDANNDVLDVELLDSRSFRGGRISLSRGTGPGGRCELRYTPPSSGFNEEDFFNYTVVDE